MPKVRHYYVTGPYSFPDDMLRYDRAKVLSTITHAGRTFYLIEGAYRPTVGRWQSFLWVVIQTKQECAQWGLPMPKAPDLDRDMSNQLGRSVTRSEAELIRQEAAEEG